MTLPIALQTYTVREPMSRDFDGTIRRIAAMGWGHTAPAITTKSGQRRPPGD